MHTTVDYTNRPNAAFDAVEDVKAWFGDKWDTISPEMSKVKHCGQFALWASFAGVSGFPVKAWYELYHGQGSWNEAELEDIS